MELPEIPFHYPYLTKRSHYVEIVYSKHNTGYNVHVYTLYLQGKGICFSTDEYHHFRQLFKNLETKSVYLRLKTLKKLIRRLVKIIHKNNIPFKGVYKIKHFGYFHPIHKANYVKLKINGYGS